MKTTIKISIKGTPARVEVPVRVTTHVSHTKHSRVQVNWPMYIKYGEYYYRRGGTGIDITNKVTGERSCTYVPINHVPRFFDEIEVVNETLTVKAV